MFFNRKKKCDRVGHKLRVQTRTGFRYPPRQGFGFFGGVVERVTEEKTDCRRCGANIIPYTEVGYTTLQGLSMPSASWDKLKRDGVLF